MGIFDIKGRKLDKKYLLACGIVIILAIICGIVLYICSGISVYTYNFADSYVFLVINFSNVRLFFSHFFVDLFYFYAFFLIGYFCKYKYFSCPVLFLKWFFAITYSIILFTCFSIEGIMVALIVFIPCFFVSTFFCIFACSYCKCINKKYVFAFPAALALVSTLVMVLLINLFFRLVIVIV